MNIVFYHPEMSEVRGGSGDIGDERVGISGTETAMLESAKALAAIDGISVYLVGFVRHTHETDGVHFVANADFDTDIVPWNAIDWFCPIFFGWEGHSDITSILERLDRARTRLLFWMHCNVPDAVLRAYDKHLPTYAQCLSQYTMKDIGHGVVRRAWVVPAGVDPAFVSPTPTPRKQRGLWSFFAVHERGGATAERAFRRVQQSCPEAAAKLQYASYYISDERRTQRGQDVVNLGALSKRAIAGLLKDTEYFVYPLVLPCATVHHDTFACVVLEAMAAGVIVVTWDVACLKEVHGGADAVIFLDPPAHPLYRHDSQFGGRNPAMLEENAVERLARAVIEIDSDPDAKARRIANGIAWARTFSWASAAARMHRELATEK